MRQEIKAFQQIDYEYNKGIKRVVTEKKHLQISRKLDTSLSTQMQSIGTFTLSRTVITTNEGTAENKINVVKNNEEY